MRDLRCLLNIHAWEEVAREDHTAKGYAGEDMPMCRFYKVCTRCGMRHVENIPGSWEGKP